MECPVCSNQELQTLEVTTEGQPIALDWCRDGCEGVWFDSGELERMDEPIEKGNENLKKLLEAERREERSQENRSCPSCSEQMNMERFDYDSWVYVDTCKHCGGTWLDGGELKIIRDTYYAEPEEEEIEKIVQNKQQFLDDLEERHDEEMQKSRETIKKGDRVFNVVWKVLTLGMGSERRMAD